VKEKSRFCLSFRKAIHTRRAFALAESLDEKDTDIDIDTESEPGRENDGIV